MGKNKKILFKSLIAQIAILLIWFSVSVLQWVLWPDSQGIKIPVIIRGIEAVSVLIISIIYIIIFEQFSFKSNSFNWKIAVIVLFAMYFSSVCSNFLSILLKYIIGYKPPENFLTDKFLLRSTWFLIPLILNIFVFLFFKIESEKQSERKEKLKAQSLAQQAKWMMLRYQVNPHFLFNALNTIRALIGINDENARKIVTEMSEYFRYSLSSNEKFVVSVEQEIKAVLNYLEIQKIRFQNKIHIETDISEDTLKSLIPIFSLQTLVENAVKYGLKTSEDQLYIEVKTYSDGDNLNIKVTNSGKIIKTINGKGTKRGIDNLRNRLNHLYPKQNSFSLYEEQGKVIAHIILSNIQNNENLEKLNS